MSAEEGTNYPELFRQMIVRGAEAALASVDPAAPTLEEDVRERSLHALTLALKLPVAWPVTNELMLAVSPYLRWQGDSSEWMAFLEEGIAAAESQSDTGALAKLHRQLGWFCRVFGRFDRAQVHSQAAYELSQQENDPATRIDALYELIALAAEQLDAATVDAYVDEMFGLTDAEDPRRALTYSALGHIAVQRGEYDRGIHWFSESIRLHTVGGQGRLAVQCEQNLALTHLYRGQYQQALAHFQHVLDTFEQCAGPLDIADVRTNIAWCYCLLQEYDLALAMCKLSEPVFVNAGDHRRLSACYNNWGLTCMYMGYYEEAEGKLLRSVELVRELNLPFETANVLESLGRVYRITGDLELACATWQEALAELRVRSVPPKRLCDMLLERIGEVQTVQGSQTHGSPSFKAD